MKCDYCGHEHDGSYASGRFCSEKCSRLYAIWKNRCKDKFTTGISFTKITFNDVDVNYIEKLIAMCNESIKECLTFNTFINKLTVAGSSVTNDRSMSWVGLAMYILIANYRLALRSSSIVYTTAASSFNFSRGNISKALSIAEQAIINLEMVEKHKSK